MSKGSTQPLGLELGLSAIKMESLLISLPTEVTERSHCDGLSRWSHCECVSTKIDLGSFRFCLGQVRRPSTPCAAETSLAPLGCFTLSAAALVTATSDPGTTLLAHELCASSGLEATSLGAFLPWGALQSWSCFWYMTDFRFRL